MNGSFLTMEGRSGQNVLLHITVLHKYTIKVRCVLNKSNTKIDSIYFKNYTLQNVESKKYIFLKIILYDMKYEIVIVI